jgi:hypothetical protein
MKQIFTVSTGIALMTSWFPRDLALGRLRSYQKTVPRARRNGL